MQYLIKGLRFYQVGNTSQRTFRCGVTWFSSGAQIAWPQFVKNHVYTITRWSYSYNDLYEGRCYIHLNCVANPYCTWDWPSGAVGSPVLQEIEDGFIFDYDIDYQPKQNILLNATGTYDELPAYDITTDVQIGDVIKYGEISNSSPKNIEITNVSYFQPYLTAVDGQDSQTPYLVPFLKGFEIESSSDDEIVFKYRPTSYEQFYREEWAYNPIESIDLVSDTTIQTINNIYPTSERNKYPLTITECVLNKINKYENSNVYHSIHLG